MERVTVALLLAALLSACATPTKTVYVPMQPVPVERPKLAIEKLDPSADAATVFKAYEESLLTCIGYAKQLEAAQTTPHQ